MKQLKPDLIFDQTSVL